MRLISNGDSAVSEILGALLLIAITSLAVSIVGVTILSSIQISQTPSISVSVTNQSRSNSIIHDGGDPLPAGSYRIYVNNVDQTASFIPDAGMTEFKAGTLLQSDGSFLGPGQAPRTAMIVYRVSGRERPF
jgi:FlaG/FlaF family flagellin (archaellin)